MIIFSRQGLCCIFGEHLYKRRPLTSYVAKVRWRPCCRQEKVTDGTDFLLPKIKAQQCHVGDLKISPYTNLGPELPQAQEVNYVLLACSVTWHPVFLRVVNPPVMSGIRQVCPPPTHTHTPPFSPSVNSLGCCTCLNCVNLEVCSTASDGWQYCEIIAGNGTMAKYLTVIKCTTRKRRGRGNITVYHIHNLSSEHTWPSGTFLGDTLKVFWGEDFHM